MNFGEAISTCFSKYATFSGRATRSEYWWFFLFTFLLGFVVELVVAALFLPWDPIALYGPTLVQLAVFLPSIAVACRRLHDIGRSGWWQLIAITVIGIIPLIIWLATDTRDEGDKYNEA